jgi:hypothetical protein
LPTRPRGPGADCCRSRTPYPKRSILIKRNGEDARGHQRGWSVRNKPVGCQSGVPLDQRLPVPAPILAGRHPNRRPSLRFHLGQRCNSPALGRALTVVRAGYMLD